MQRTILNATRLAPAALLLAGAFGDACAQDATPANEVRVGAYFVHYQASATDLSGPFTPAGINIRVWAHTPNTLTKGSAAIILEYDATRARYLIQAAPDS